MDRGIALNLFKKKVYNEYKGNFLKGLHRRIDSMRTVSAVDIFCGAGGMTYGLIKAGINLVAGIDSDETCRYVFERNNRSRFIATDVKLFSGCDLAELLPVGDIKVLVGCAPCQPFSNHTQKDKRRNADENWGLLYHFLRLIYECMPDIVSMENVTQIEKQKVFTDFVNGLSSLEYNVTWESVYCPDYGIPQTRTRLVLLASKLGNIGLIPRTHSKANYRTVRDAIGKLEAIEAGEVSGKDTLHTAARLTPINMTRIRASKPGGTWRDWDEELRLPCHKKETGKSYVSVYGRMAWGKPAPTITTQFYNYGTGRFGHPDQDRALSIREGALLQTFPRYYKFIDPKQPASFQQIAIHIGNAVPVRLGVIIGRSILKHVKESCNESA